MNVSHCAAVSDAQFVITGSEKANASFEKAHLYTITSYLCLATLDDNNR